MNRFLLSMLAMLLCLWHASAQDPMVLQYNTNLSDGTTIALPLYGAVNVTVDWGDGTTNTYTTEGVHEHTYATHGQYTVFITGSLQQFGASSTVPGNDKLQAVTSFGNLGLSSLAFAFRYATNLAQVPATLPASVTDLSWMFSFATAFNGDISGWNVSSVTNMDKMFMGATAFNGDISEWNVSSVTNMDEMFMDATDFNGDIGGWDVSSVTSMFHMFYNATSFDQDIGGWDVSNVFDMFNMFRKVKLSTHNYNSLLVGWSNRTLKDNVVFNAGLSRYSSGIPALARQHIIDTFHLDIDDDGETNLPTLTTAPITTITPTTATGGGDVINNGGSDVIVRGVLWSTTPKPTTGNHDGITMNGTGTGRFTSSLTGLVPNTTYYVRAYAINTNGTDYGPQVSFHTPSIVLTIGGSFTVHSKEYDGTDVAEINQNNLTLVGVVGNDEVFLTNVRVRFTQTEVGEGIPVVIYEAELNGADRNCYTLSLEGAPTALGNITKPSDVESDLLMAVKAYPNPFDTHIRFAGVEGTLHVCITSIAGIKLMECDIAHGQDLRVDHLSRGIYFVTLTGDNGHRRTLRMVKQ